MPNMSVVDKKRFLSGGGYSLLNYSGKMKDAPQQVRHIFRDCPPGWYVVNPVEKAVYPLPTPSDGAGATAELVDAAFYIVLAYKLSELDWVFYNKNRHDVSVLDMRKDPSWNSGRYMQQLKLLPAHAGNGFYAAREGENIVGPVATEPELFEVVATQVGLLADYTEVRPFDGALQAVMLAPNVYVLMTEQDEMLALLAFSAQTNAMASARMFAAAPDMLVLIDYLATAPVSEYPQIAVTANQLRQAVFQFEQADTTNT